MNAYLVIKEHGGLFAVYLDRDEAERDAKTTGAVVAAVPVVADYREEPRP